MGALLEALLIPGLHLGKNPYRAPGCFYPGHVNGLQCALLSCGTPLCHPAVRNCIDTLQCTPLPRTVSAASLRPAGHGKCVSSQWCVLGGATTASCTL